MESDLAGRKLELALEVAGVLGGNGRFDDRDVAGTGREDVFVGLGKDFFGSDLDRDIIGVKPFGANKEVLLHNGGSSVSCLRKN